jgi:hypothetical protein
MKKIAAEYYSQRKGNCAQAVAAAWSQFNNSDGTMPSEFSSFGHGKAPEGLCGALYAACVIAGSHKENDIKNAFAEKSGGNTTCRDIRSTRVLTCPECVLHAAELLCNNCIKQSE